MRTIPIAQMFCLALLAAVASACGGSGGGSGDSGFDFDRFSYPGIVPVPRAAFEAGRATDGGDNTSASGPLGEQLAAGADTPTDDPVVADWNTLIGLASNGQDDRDVQRYYLVYETETNPTSGICTVTVRVIEGLPYDPQRAPVATYVGSASIGEQHRDGFPIAGAADCENEAAHRAGELIVAGGLFAEGWSNAHPAHTQP